MAGHQAKKISRAAAQPLKERQEAARKLLIRAREFNQRREEERNKYHYMLGLDEWNKDE